MRSRPWGLRAAALLFAGVLALHQLRYALAPGGEPRHGHGYLDVVIPCVPAALVLAGVQLARALGVARRRGTGEALPPAVPRLWTYAGSLLLVTHLVQEAAERLVNGIPVTPASLVGAGAWIALPLAVALGLLIALLLRGTAIAVARVAGRPVRTAHRRAAAELPRPPRRIPCAAPDAVARHLAARGPPAVSW
jgi:hypothetical protein